MQGKTHDHLYHYFYAARTCAVGLSCPGLACFSIGPLSRPVRTCYDRRQDIQRRKEDMSTRRRRFTRSTGVTLEVAVLDYLRELAEKDDRDRSFCINQIVREHAERSGRSLPPATQPPGPRPAPTQEQ